MHAQQRIREDDIEHSQDRQVSSNGQFFEYSRCTGRRKALLVSCQVLSSSPQIGINYVGTKSELRGCVNDALNVQRFLCERYAYDPSDIVLLTDTDRNPRSQPTHDNIIRAMQWLVNGASKDDALFFHYSGHGTTVEIPNNPTGEAESEAICPLDYNTAGLIVDLDTGCRLTAIFDSCHSGTVMNLPYMYSTQGKVKDPNNYAQEGGSAFLSSAMQYATGNDIGAAMGMFSAAKNMFMQKRSVTLTRTQNTSPADVISWSGCKDVQTSADTTEAGQATGAMSYAFIRALSAHPRVSYVELLRAVREEMQRGGYSQKPQLSASHEIDTNLEFVA